MRNILSVLKVSLVGLAVVPIAVAAVLVAGAMSSAEAAEIEIVFGELSPSGPCTFSAGDHGLVCSNPQTFSASGDTFTAIGFAGQFATPSALTFKPLTGSGTPEAGIVSNVFMESG